jgi:hypothetical protein
MLNNALRIDPLEDTIKIRKLNFMLKLLKHQTTREIIKFQLENQQRIHPKSLTAEIKKQIKLANVNKGELRSEFQKEIETKISNIEENISRNQETKTAIAIRYLLENNTRNNQELAKKLMRWDNKKSIK